MPFSDGVASVEHFEFVERPHGADVRDSDDFAPTRRYRRAQAMTGRLSPLSLDYETVGALYAALRAGLDAFAARHGEDALFLGDPALQVDVAHAPLPGVCRVVDLASAQRAIDTIVTQGEGAGAETAAKAAWLGVSAELMRALVPVGQGLAARPPRLTAPRAPRPPRRTR